MTELVFVDTNVFVYNRDASEPKKGRRAHAWIEHLWRTGNGRLSFQVLQEFYVTVTLRLKPGIGVEDAADEVRELCAWNPVPIDLKVLEGAWIAQQRFSLSWWDALIVSAAKLAGCRYLLTEDLQTGQVLDSLVVVDPFKTAPEELSAGSGQASQD